MKLNNNSISEYTVSRNKSVAVVAGSFLLLGLTSFPSFADVGIGPVTITKIDVGADNSINFSHSPYSCGTVTTTRAWLTPMADPGSDILKQKYALILMAHATGKSVAYYTATCTLEDNLANRVFLME